MFEDFDSVSDDGLDAYFTQLEDLEWGREAAIGDWLEHNVVELGVW